jgi:shikimate dehydrogenase
MNAPYAEVIGDPIAQSKSPLIHGFWLEALGLTGSYARAHVKPEGLAAYIEERRGDPDWRGCNVTMPHKAAVMDLVDDPGDIRGTIGAMNTVVRQKDGSLIGTNTDAAGFYSPLAELDLEGAPVAVVGAGGAARAVLFALARAHVGPVTILNRSPLKAMGLLATFGLKGDVVAPGAALPPVALLVNASSLGMKGQPPLELDQSPLTADAIVYDLVYSPLQTGLLGAAEARGLDTVDGLDMLIGQAALAFELFFGAAPPEGRDEELRALLTA